jgi:peroxiredoxin
MTNVQETLVGLLGELHAERLRTWPPEQVEANVSVRRDLVVSEDRSLYLQAGERVADFRLPEVDGGEVVLGDLLTSGPAVLIFFRFAGCPACNIALPYYQRALWPGLRRLGAGLVALSPQVPERLVDIKRRHGLEFAVATDVDNHLARLFGVTFEPDDEAKARALARGGRAMSDVTGASTWELPKPAVIVIGQDQRAAFVDVTPDWLARTEAGPILEAVESLRRENLAA